MKLRFTPTAIENLAQISEHLRERSPAAMVHVRSAMYDGLETLLLFPRIGRKQEVGGVRRLVTRRYGYLI